AIYRNSRPKGGRRFWPSPTSRLLAARPAEHGLAGEKARRLLGLGRCQGGLQGGNRRLVIPNNCGEEGLLSLAELRELPAEAIAELRVAVLLHAIGVERRGILLAC